MTAPAETANESPNRAWIIGVAGILIILLGAGAAALPMLDRLSGTRVVGSLLFAAGLIELIAGTVRKPTRAYAMLAGALTMAAGLLFLFNRTGYFFPTVTIVTGWLILRSLVLLVAYRFAQGSVRLWLGLAAATEFLLGALLLVGLSISALVVSLFGPTPALVASFSWVLALSFVVTGVLLLEVASCERETAD